MNDEFLHQFREAPRAEFTEGLYRRISREPKRWAAPSIRMPLDGRTPRRWALSALAMLLIIAATAVTPWGQAFAQNLFRFFSPAEGDSFPLPTEELGLYGAEPTPAATFQSQLKPAGPGAAEPEEAPTAIPATFIAPAVEGCKSTAASLTYRCQVAKAEAAVGFDAKEPPGNIEGMTFSGAGANPSLQLLTLKYTAIGGGSYLTITQIRGEFRYASSWGQIPPSAAIEDVKVGGFDAEYVRGMFMVKPGATSAVWEPEAAVRRLRWEEGDTLYEIRLDGHVGRAEWLDRDTMIELAESLVYTPDSVEGQLRPEYLTSVEDAETLAGYFVLAPTVLPEGFVFDFAEYHAEDQSVWLRYNGGGSTGSGGFLIFETPLDVAQPFDLADDFPPGVVENVQVSGQPGQYAAGSNNIHFEGTRTPGAPTPTPAWRPDAPDRRLVWTTDTLQIFMIFYASDWYGGRLDKADMIAIAESMR